VKIKRLSFMPQEAIKAIENGHEVRDLTAIFTVEVVDGKHYGMVGLGSSGLATLISVLNKSEEPVGRALGEMILQGFVALGDTYDEELDA